VVPHAILASTGFDASAAGTGALVLGVVGGGLVVLSTRRRRIA
jgi:LPXTG-motif cell wall-anchored protein